jgi:hypothetical protein
MRAIRSGEKVLRDAAIHCIGGRPQRAYSFASQSESRPMSDADLMDRVAELEQRAQRFKLATTGVEGWENYFQSLIMQERDYFNDFLTALIAQFHRQLLDETKAMLDQALATRVRGTYQAGISYVRGDMVALDGGSFVARKDNPGKCPGDGWQLMAKQGQRGIAGPQGERGPAGKTITGWVVDRSEFRITPRLSDGSLGPALELRELFEPQEGRRDE